VGQNPQSEVSQGSVVTQKRKRVRYAGYFNPPVANFLYLMILEMPASEDEFVKINIVHISIDLCCLSLSYICLSRLCIEKSKIKAT